MSDIATPTPDIIRQLNEQVMLSGRDLRCDEEGYQAALVMNVEMRVTCPATRRTCSRVMHVMIVGGNQTFAWMLPTLVNADHDKLPAVGSWLNIGNHHECYIDAIIRHLATLFFDLCDQSNPTMPPGKMKCVCNFVGRQMWRVMAAKLAYMTLDDKPVFFIQDERKVLDIRKEPNN
jgi:hypothetical protein